MRTVQRPDPRIYDRSDHVLIVDSSPSTPAALALEPRSRFSLDAFVRSVAQIPMFYRDPPPEQLPFIRVCPQMLPPPKIAGPDAAPILVPLPSKNIPLPKPKILQAPPLADKIEDTGCKTRTNFTEQQRSILNGYLQVRQNNPYANASDISKLREVTGLTARQIRTYLTNRRMRYSKEMNYPRPSKKK
jgi:hypothetical protein